MSFHSITPPPSIRKPPLYVSKPNSAARLPSGLPRQPIRIPKPDSSSFLNLTDAQASVVAAFPSVLNYRPPGDVFNGNRITTTSESGRTTVLPYIGSGAIAAGGAKPSGRARDRRRTDPFESAGTSLIDRTIPRHAPKIIERQLQAQQLAEAVRRQREIEVLLIERARIEREAYEAAHRLPIGDMEVGELIGWRIWKVQSDGLLKSFSAPNTWLPSVDMIGKPGDHDEAGVWAFKEKKRAAEKQSQYMSNHIYGKVALWGNVVEHTDGWRAEFCRILWLDLRDLEPELAKQVRKNYGKSGVKFGRFQAKAAKPSPFVEIVDRPVTPPSVPPARPEPKPNRLWDVLGLILGVKKA